MDAMDFVASGLLLPVHGILIALFAGWRWRSTEAAGACDLGLRAASRAWRASLRYLVPTLVMTVLIQLLLAR